MDTKQINNGKQIHVSRVGPINWFNRTKTDIRESNSCVRRSKGSCEICREKNMPPGTRKILSETGNVTVNRYTRSVRDVTNILRQSVINVNMQIRSMINCEQELNKTVNLIETDIIRNQYSKSTRGKKPAREKLIDDADLLIEEEGFKLNSQKCLLKNQLKHIRTDLLELNKITNRLKSLLNKSSKVSFLAPDSTISSEIRKSKSFPKKEKYNDMSQSKDLPNIIEGVPYKNVSSFSNSLDNNNNENYSMASLNLDNDTRGNILKSCLISEEIIELNIKKSIEAMQTSKNLKTESDNLIANFEEERAKMCRKVDNVLRKKMMETKQLKEQLENAIFKNKMAANKAQRLFYDTEHSWLDLRGPESVNYSTIKEKSTRPIINISFNKHPELASSQFDNDFEKRKGTAQLLQSLHKTAQDIGLLKVAELKLQGDAVDKGVGLNLDRQVSVMRKKKVVI